MSLSVGAVYKEGGLGLVVTGTADGPLRVVYGKTTTLQGYKIFNAIEDGTSRSCDTELCLSVGEHASVAWHLKGAKFEDVSVGQRMFIISENTSGY
jgi:hypothetical protein